MKTSLISHVHLGAVLMAVGLAVLPAMAEDAVPTNAVGQLTLTSGERLRGELLDIRDGRIRWSHPDALRPFTFALTNVAEMVFDERPDLSRQPPKAALVTLWASAEGGFAPMDADLLGMDERQAQFRSSAAGTFNWPRCLMKSITFPRSGGDLLVGGEIDTNVWVVPNFAGNECWTAQGRQWMSRGRALVSRKVGLPDRFRLDFDTEMSQFVSFRIGLYVPETRTDFREIAPGYYLEYRRGGEFVILRADATNRTRALAGGCGFPIQNAKAHFTLLVSKPDRTFVLFGNGRRLKVWKDNEAELPPLEDGVSITAMGKPFTLANLEIRQWHGNLDAVGDLTDPKEDLVYLVDGQRLTGHISGVCTGVVTLATASGVISQPLERIERLDFFAPDVDLNKPENASLKMPGWRAFCTDGSELPLCIESFADGLLQATLTGGNPATLRAGYLRRLAIQAPPGQTPPPKEEENDRSRRTILRSSVIPVNNGAIMIQLQAQP